MGVNVSTTSASSVHAPRKRRALPFAAAAALLFVGVASCTSLLGLDDFESASGELCDLLDTCYADPTMQDCKQRLDTLLRTADVETRTSWLVVFGDQHCLGSCTDARGCLDAAPVCHAGSCGRREECCGFLRGHADCVGARCCAPRGIECLTDADCCEGAGDCDKDTRTCGGTVCLEGGSSCVLNAQCCTGICKNGACADEICVEDGFSCDGPEDCCNQACDATGHCNVPPTCQPIAGACMQDADCCGDLACDLGVCAVPICFPTNSECIVDADCCSNHCDPTYSVCGFECAPTGSFCSGNAECCTGVCDDGECGGACSTAYCMVDADCCSDHCVLGTCAAVCIPSLCDHDVCHIGGPLDGGKCADDAACVTAVCAEDPYCCCGAWDAVCVAEAAAKPNECPASCN